MKGFGNNKKINNDSLEKKFKSLHEDKLISKAFSLHSKGKLKEASEIYNFLIENKFFDKGI